MDAVVGYGCFDCISAANRSAPFIYVVLSTSVPNAMRAYEGSRTSYTKTAEGFALSPNWTRLPRLHPFGCWLFVGRCAGLVLGTLRACS